MDRVKWGSAWLIFPRALLNIICQSSEGQTQAKRKINEETGLHNPSLHPQIPALKLSCYVAWATGSTPLAQFSHRSNGHRQNVVRNVEYHLCKALDGSAHLMPLLKDKGHSTRSFYTMKLLKACVPYVLTASLTFQGDVGLCNP